MNFRIILAVGSAVVCLATVTGVLVRGRQLGDLRAEQQFLLSQREAPTEISSPPRALQNTLAKVEQRSTASPSLELLRLRSEVNRLTNRRRELAAARGENERLRIQVAASRTNVSAANALPPGYLRKVEARFVGYNTPADTMQSLLWAVQNRDFTNLLAAFTPETAHQMAKGFFENASAIPGMHIKNQQQMPDGSIELGVEMVPGEPLRIRFRLINGQWKWEL